MSELVRIIIEALPNNEMRSRVLGVLESKMAAPDQAWIDALREAARQADELLTNRYWNS
jgi:hypothetical protein